MARPHADHESGSNQFRATMLRQAFQGFFRVHPPENELK